MPFSLDPQIQAAVQRLPEELPRLPPGEWRERRRRFDEMAADLTRRLPVPTGVDVLAAQATAADCTAIGLRVYRRRADPTGALILYLHGGGHFCCSIDTSDKACRWYASDSGATLVSVDYRFAPEHPYPTAVEDAYAALAWVAAHGRELGGDPARLGIMGDSAGGGMAAGVALMARDRGGPVLTRQVLIYPMLDDRTTEPDREIEPFLAWTYADNVTAWQALLGEAAGTAKVPAYAAPARAEELAGLPPTYIEVGQLDAFRDEDVDYATRLSRAGVEVELHVRPGVPHDFELVAPEAEVTRRAAADRARVLGSM